jgi:nucleotide-binding universal stress UspA family protein
MNILMLTDFSTNASHSHRYALELYKNQHINSYLLHVKKPCLNSQKCSGKCKFGLYQKLVKQAQDLVNDGQHLAPKAIFAEGSFIEEVRSAIHKYNIDVLFIGAKGKSANNKELVGTYTQAIATKVKCPLFIVFENTPIAIPKSALFPVNYTDALYPACLNKLKSLPFWKGLSVNVLELKSHLNLEHLMLSSKRILENYLKNASVEFSNLVNQDIQITKEASKYNLMVYAAKNLSVGNRIFSELKKNKEAFEFKTPLFVLHA